MHGMLHNGLKVFEVLSIKFETFMLRQMKEEQEKAAS
jgi:hypothetical protein